MAPVSSAVVTTSKMELTPMRVSFNGTDLGGTLGNCSVMVEYTKAEIKADQSGETPRDRRVSGVKFSVTTELAEINDMTKWKVVFPHAKIVGSAPNQMIYFQAAVGDSDLSNAHQLVLHPLSKADADLSGDYKFFLACADAKSEVVYGPGAQSKLKVIWNILPDASVQPERFFIHGDPTIGIVAAVAGTPALVGTGNGTMGSVVAYNGFTKTETVTATCVTAVVNGGVFEVHGSISGPMGLATVGTNFVAFGGEISFTIADGATDFIVGDAFTVATTAANFS